MKHFPTLKKWLNIIKQLSNFSLKSKINNKIIFLSRATNEDEMCNFYLMYYVNQEEPLEMKYCFSPGPPFYHWNDTDVGLNNIPDYDASHLNTKRD